MLPPLVTSRSKGLADVTAEPLGSVPSQRLGTRISGVHLVIGKCSNYKLTIDN